MLSVSIIPSDEFVRQAKRLLKKHKTLIDDLEELQQLLLTNPFIGTDLGGGKRKIRLKVSSKNKGKSGGFRVITFNVVETEAAVVVPNSFLAVSKIIFVLSSSISETFCNFALEL